MLRFEGFEANVALMFEVRGQHWIYDRRKGRPVSGPLGLSGPPDMGTSVRMSGPVFSLCQGAAMPDMGPVSISKEAYV